MTNNLHNIVVHIKDEAMLQEAREILESYGEKVSILLFNLNKDKTKNYLLKGPKWFIDGIEDDDIEITLPELEQLLKQNRDENC